MKSHGFIKVTRFDEKLEPKYRKPENTLLINIEEIAVVMCFDNGSVIFLKDYATKLYVLESEKELQFKINTAKGGMQ